MNKEFKAITTVYSYYTPEIRDLIDNLVKNYPHDVFLKSVTPGLDDFHQPVIDKLIAYHKSDVPDLDKFQFRYPTSGSEEGIREYMTQLQSKGVKRVYMLKGDYEGYREVAKTRGLETIEVDYGTDYTQVEPGHWFLSNPSARDGNILSDEEVNKICEAGHKIFYDLAYLGATDFHRFDLSHPNIIAAVVSFSKPYGLFYYRIGFTFTKEEIPSLYANKWFKNIYGLLIAEKILEKVNQKEYAFKYKKVQASIIEKVNQEFNLGLRSSDAFLLAYLPEADAQKLSPEQLKLIERFKRNDNYRFCLTSYFQEQENRW